MRKLITLFGIAPLLLSGCKVYSSKYKALLLVTTNNGNSATMSFEEFEGTYVFKLKKQNKGESDIKFAASLESGKINVEYYAFNNESNLFTISGGETLNDHSGYIEHGYKVSIIVTAEEKAINGHLTFNLD